jgi:cytochrome P450
MAYLPFSAGPRKCLGMRFALLEIKVAVVKILKEYTVRKSSGTPEKIELDVYTMTSSSRDPILVKIESRI